MELYLLCPICIHSMLLNLAQEKLKTGQKVAGLIPDGVIGIFN
jgi:hypothetical protein